jgi:DNA invertase Pin-like site-specific DNA recombinase
MMGAIRQMEREILAERAAAGRASAKARAKTGGRPRTDIVKLRDAKVLYDNSGKTAAEVCKVVGVGDASSSPTSLNSESRSQHPLRPIKPFRGVGQK